MTDTPEPLFVIAWEHRANPGIVERGTIACTRHVTEATILALNDECPQYRHWVEPYTEDKT